MYIILATPKTHSELSKRHFYMSIYWTPRPVLLESVSSISGVCVQYLQLKKKRKKVLLLSQFLGSAKEWFILKKGVFKCHF
jgi:hypothetical protein